MQAEWDQGYYPTGVEVTNEQLAAVPLAGHDWHPEWNYDLGQDLRVTHGAPRCRGRRRRIAPAPQLGARLAGTTTDAHFEAPSRTTTPHFSNSIRSRSAVS